LLLAASATHPLWSGERHIQPREGCMNAYDQHHPRGPVFALRDIIAGLAGDLH
jgi:hypothetical protein